MTDALKLAALCAFSVFGVVVSLSCCSLTVAVAAGVSAFVALFIPLRRQLPDGHEGLWELAPIAVFLPLAFLWSATPGADAAMYAAIARALLAHSPDLSAAYPGVHVAMYPRAFPGLAAIFSLVLGMAKANVVAAMLAYVVFATGLRVWLREFVSGRAALIIAVLLCVLSRNVPLGFFSWGGSPTILAFGMSLLAIVLAADAMNALIVGCAALILAGAFSVHPIGAFAGAACAPCVVLRRGAWLQRTSRVLLIVVAVAPLMLSFKHFGPAISQREAEWIARWQAGPANPVHDRFGFFVLDYLEAFMRGLGPVLTAVIGLCLCRAWVVRDDVIAVSILVLGVIYVALLMTLGPHLPVVGTFIYADRMTPMWLVAAAPLVAVTATRVRLPVLSVQMALCVALIVVSHVHCRLGEPFANDDELALIECIRTKVPAGAWIVASYGQGGQWLPALTGNPITQPHVHCSLFDETDATRATVEARYQLLSDHPPQFNTTALPTLPAAETICERGSAKLVRLLNVAPPIAGIY